MVKELLTPGKIGETTLKTGLYFPRCAITTAMPRVRNRTVKEYVRARAREARL